MSIERPLVWVIGRGGMLGSRVQLQVGQAGMETWSAPGLVSWTRPDTAAALLQHDYVRAADGRDLLVFWCAGASTPGSDRAEAEREVLLVERLLAGFPASSRGRTTFFLASSSAGAVHAGAAAPPVAEASPPAPLSGYGHAKLAVEDVARRWTETVDGRVAVGRVSNIDGPGQDLRKAQGLVTRLLLAQQQRRPLLIYGPLNTIRDYLYVNDAAALAVAAAARQHDLGGSTFLAGQGGISIAALIGEIGRVLRRRPPYVLGSSPLAAVRPRDLTMRSLVWRDLDALAATPLPVGLHRTWQHLLPAHPQATAGAAA